VSLVGPNLAASWPSDLPAAGVSPPRKRSPRWRMLFAVAAVLVGTPVIVLLAKAASYQPLSYGSTGVSTLA